MQQRGGYGGVQFNDIRRALSEASSATQQPKDRWKVVGPDLDGDELTVIVIIEDGLIVCTVY